MEAAATTRANGANDMRTPVPRAGRTGLESRRLRLWAFVPRVQPRDSRGIRNARTSDGRSRSPGTLVATQSNGSQLVPEGAALSSANDPAQDPARPLPTLTSQSGPPHKRPLRRTRPARPNDRYCEGFRM